VAGKPEEFANVDTAADDVCLIAFTSGSTGQPKATLHFHRDVMAACACWPPYILEANSDDVFIGSPPLAFTFGLGGLLLFPLSIGAATVLIEKVTPDSLLAAIDDFRATICVTAPTSYRAMAAGANQRDLRSLRKCVSAGEALPAATRQLWKDATGIELIDGIGTTELLHIFLSHRDSDVKPGATGKPVPGYTVLCWTTCGRRRRNGRCSRSRDRLGAATSRTSANATTSRTDGTSPATRTWWTKTAGLSIRHGWTT
jgi:2-aminobenzoate-CoA ligase